MLKLHKISRVFLVLIILETPLFQLSKTTFLAAILSIAYVNTLETFGYVANVSFIILGF